MAVTRVLGVGHLRLAELCEQLDEPRRVQIEALAALDPLELDWPERAATLLVVPNQAGLCLLYTSPSPRD